MGKKAALEIQRGKQTVSYQIPVSEKQNLQERLANLVTREQAKIPQPVKNAGFYRCCRTHAGAGDRSEHSDFQCRRKCSASASSLSPSGEFGGDLEHLSATDPPGRIVSWRLRRLASASDQFFRDGSLRGYLKGL